MFGLVAAAALVALLAVWRRARHKKHRQAPTRIDLFKDGLTAMRLRLLNLGAGTGPLPRPA